MTLDTQDLEQIRDIVFEGMQATVDALNPCFESLETKVDSLEVKVDSLGTAVDKLEGRVGNLEGKVGNLESGQAETNRRLTKLEARFDSFEGKLEAIENDIKELYAMVNSQPTIKNKAEFKQYAESVILDAHKRLTALAKEVGVSLPSSKS
jgi:chromosome segregation ATPase